MADDPQVWRYKRAAPTPGRACIDCVDEWQTSRKPTELSMPSPRPAPFPGPRCYSHDRVAVKARKLKAKTDRVQRTYGLDAEGYEALRKAQGGKCFICRRANGSTKRLAVDHDHACCPGPTSCGQCVRGLLCDVCNRMLGHLRDNPEAWQRGADYLRSSPSGWRTGYGIHGRSTGV